MKWLMCHRLRPQIDLRSAAGEASESDFDSKFNWLMERNQLVFSFCQRLFECPPGREVTPDGLGPWVALADIEQRRLLRFLQQRKRLSSGVRTHAISKQQQSLEPYRTLHKASSISTRSKDQSCSSSRRCWPKESRRCVHPGAGYRFDNGTAVKEGYGLCSLVH